MGKLSEEERVRRRRESRRKEYKKNKDKYRAHWEKNREKRKVQSREWREKNKEYRKRYTKEHWLRTRYNLTLAEHDALIAAHDNKCAICSYSFEQGTYSKRRHIDHCHVTGKIRGLLCHSCNTSLGGFKDSKELLLKAIQYLEAGIVQVSFSDKQGNIVTERIK